MIAGAGSIQSMITILRNNKNMLRKKSLFRKDKSFLNLREEYLKATPIHKKIDSKKLSKEELEEIRLKVIKSYRKDNIKTFLTASVIMIVLIGFVYHVSHSIYMDLKKYQEVEGNQIKEQKLYDVTEKFNFYVADGDKWMESLNYKNAVFQYENALALIHDDTEVEMKLAEALTFQCYYDAKDCEKAKEYLQNSLKENPQSEKLNELIQYIKE